MTLVRRHAATAPGAGMRRSTASSQRVMVLTIVDQGASSVSNFALAIIVAHYSSASRAGRVRHPHGHVRAEPGPGAQPLQRLPAHPFRDGRGLRFEVRAGRLPGRHRPVDLPGGAPRRQRRPPHAFTLPFVIFAVSFPLMACQDFAASSGSAATTPPTPSGSTSPGSCSSWCLRGARRPGSPPCRGCSGPGAAPARSVGLWTLRAHLARWTAASPAVLGRERAGRRSPLRRPVHALTSWSVLHCRTCSSSFFRSAIGDFKLFQLALGPITVLLVGCNRR